MSELTPLAHDVVEEAQMPLERNGATFYRVSEAAKFLEVHRNTIIYWIKEGQMKAKKQGIAEKSPYIIPKEEVEKAKKEMQKAV